LAFGDIDLPTTPSGGAAMFGSRKHVVRVTRALGIVALTLAMATPVAAKGPAVVHRVSAGGPDQCSGLGVHPGCDGNYSLVATQFADGSASGQYTDRFGRIGGIRGVVDCLAVVGSDAWISGWIVSGRFEDQDLGGLPFSTRIRDNGASMNEPPDQISSSHTGDETPCSDMAPWNLVDAVEGQVVVN
jgi:hypothetical protein